VLLLLCGVMRLEQSRIEDKGNLPQEKSNEQRVAQIMGKLLKRFPGIVIML
jgi:hypothetical protein